MKSVIRVVMLAGMLVSFAGIAAAHPADGRIVDRRESFQRHRIRDGVRCGDLTRRETRRLVRGQARIHRMERRFERDGRFTWRERQRMDRLQDRESRRIYRLKHNRNQRWS
jgi:hypothetical protein